MCTKFGFTAIQLDRNALPSRSIENAFQEGIDLEFGNLEGNHETIHLKMHVAQ